MANELVVSKLTLGIVGCLVLIALVYLIYRGYVLYANTTPAQHSAPAQDRVTEAFANPGVRSGKTLVADEELENGNVVMFEGCNADPKKRGKMASYQPGGQVYKLKAGDFGPSGPVEPNYLQIPKFRSVTFYLTEQMKDSSAYTLSGPIDVCLSDGARSHKFPGGTPVFENAQMFKVVSNEPPPPTPPEPSSAPMAAPAPTMQMLPLAAGQGNQMQPWMMLMMMMMQQQGGQASEPMQQMMQQMMQQTMQPQQQPVQQKQQPQPTINRPRKPRSARSRQLSSAWRSTNSWSASGERRRSSWFQSCRVSSPQSRPSQKGLL
jgi:hypothetical protein